MTPARRAIERHQTAVLSDRYLEVMIHDLKGTGLLLIQAPLIAFGVAGVWSNISGDSEALYFVLSLSAFFLGAINASREIVKERALFLREKHFNLSVRAYLSSKLRVQAILVLLQCALLAGIVRVFVPIKVNVLWLAIALIGVALAGTACGLLVSAWVTRSDRAVAMVPLLVIPQILFSDFVLGKEQLANWTGRVQDWMPVEWGYIVLTELRDRNHTDWFRVLSAPVVLGALIGVAFLLAWRRLAGARYG
ncbi:MAG: ABC transporter permease [Deltaproteobacteria bacterium]|nr:ABC transporter permease [Deltaproteobacteria bacterium]